MSSTPKPGELPLSRMLNSQPGPLLERGAGGSSRADQAASEPETVLRRFPFQSERSRPGMGRVRQARVCPLLDTYAWFEVSTLKVFGGDYEPRDLSSQAELPIPLARHERRADRASAAFCAVQNDGLERDPGEERRRSTANHPCGPRGLPLDCPSYRISPTRIRMELTTYCLERMGS